MAFAEVLHRHGSHAALKGTHRITSRNLPMALRKRRDMRGATLIEFALVFLPLVMLIFGTIEFGRYFFVQHVLQFATREGVRLALVGRTLNDGNGNPMSREASIIKVIDEKAAIAVPPSDVQISIYPINSDYSDPTGWQGTQNAGNPGSYMRVKTRYTFQFLTPIFAAMLPSGQLVVQAQATYRNEIFN